MIGDGLLGVVYVLLIIACIWDWLLNRIPNTLIIMIFISYVSELIFQGQNLEILFFIIRFIIVCILAYPLFKIGAVGAGDIKLLGICSGFFGKDKILLFVFFSMLISAIFSILKMCKDKNLKERFGYLMEYLSDISKNKQIKPYFNNEVQKRKAGICMSTPIFLSVVIMKFLMNNFV